MPPMPTWNSVHPMVVHFPIALLMVAPLLILAAVASAKAWRPLAVAALMLVVLGTAGSMLAVASGEAAEDAARAVTLAKTALHDHEEAGELTRNVFLGLGALFACIVGATALSARLGRRWFVWAALVYLLPYVAGLAVLANTAHTGGLLVHHYGVRAPMPAPPSPADRD